MPERLMPWLPSIFCATLSLLAVGGDVAGRFMTGTANIGLTTFLCFLPICFLLLGVMVRNLQDENRRLQQRLDEISGNDNERKSAA